MEWYLTEDIKCVIGDILRCSKILSIVLVIHNDAIIKVLIFVIDKKLSLRWVDVRNIVPIKLRKTVRVICNNRYNELFLRKLKEEIYVSVNLYDTVRLFIGEQLKSLYIESNIDINTCYK